MEERELSLADILADIMLHWRGIILMMLVGAILLGAVSYMRSYHASKAQAARVEKAREEIAQKEAERLEFEKDQQELGLSEHEMLKNILLEELTDLQVRAVEYVMSYESLYNDKMSYRENSLIMQMDPNNVKRAEVTIMVSASEPQNSHDIEKVYEDIVCSGEAIAYIAEQIGCEANNISEGITLGRGSSGMVEENTFRMVILHYDEDVCRKMLQAAIDFVNITHGELEQAMGEHEVAVIYQSLITVIDTDILVHQRSYLSDIETLANTIETCKANFTPEEWDYYDFLENGKLTGLREEYEKKVGEERGETGEGNKEQTPEEIVKTGVTVVPGISKKYVVLGAMLMVFAYAFIIFLRYILNNKLKETDSLPVLYGLPQLGEIPVPVHEKKFLGFVDKWIISVRDRNKRKFSRDEALGLAIVAVKMAVSKEAIKEVCLVGCDLKDQAMETCRTIKEKLVKEEIQVDILSNVLYDASAMEELEKTKSVVLVEKAGSTLYNEIAQELELLKRQEIKVLGGIVIGEG